MGSGHPRIDRAAERARIRTREPRIVRVLVRLRFQCNERTSQTARSLKRMQAFRTRLLEFLFPPETDYWLAILRVGLGFEVIFIRCLCETIGVFCFRGLRARWRKHCFLWKAILSRHWGGSLLWRHNSACAKRG